MFLPEYQHREYKPRASRWKFTIFEPSRKILAEEEGKEFPGGETKWETGRRGEEGVTGREEFLGTGGVKTLILDWETRARGGEGEDVHLLPVENNRNERRASQDFRNTVQMFVRKGEGDSEKLLTAKPMLSFASISQNFNSHTSALGITAAWRKINFRRNYTFSSVVGSDGLTQ